MEFDDLIKKLLQNLVIITDKKVNDMNVKEDTTQNYSNTKSWLITALAIGLIFAVATDLIPLSADYWLSRIFTFY